MSTQPIGKPLSHLQTELPAPINIAPSGLAGLKLYKREIATYLRELPRLWQKDMQDDTR